MELSKEQFNCLQLVGRQSIMLVPQSMLEVCKYLKSEGYIEMITVLTVDNSQDYPEGELHMNDATIIIQITQKGSAYLASHIKKKTYFNIDLIAKFFPILISVIALLFSILKP